MPNAPEQFDFFVSYARADNKTGWVTDFVEALLAEHRRFVGGDEARVLRPFFDKQDIHGLDDWRHRLQEGIGRSRLFLAFISPNYFASEWCRREWKAWLDTEIAKHILSAGAAPVYLVEVPGFIANVAGLREQQRLGEQEVARQVAGLCGLPVPHDGFVAAASPLVRQFRERRQVLSDFVQPFADEGVAALRREDLRRELAKLARELDERAERVRRADASLSTVPTYNRKFTGRLDELHNLREQLFKDDCTGVIYGVHGLGGMGKSELAFAYAHAFASAYPGGRFLLRCEGKASVRDAVLGQSDFTALFRDQIGDEERKQPEVYFAAIAACLRERLEELGHVLLVLDNVTDPALLLQQQTQALTVLGPRLHLLATTRMVPPAGGKSNWLTLGALPEDAAMELLEKYRPFADEEERAAALRIVKRLGGFTLAVELVAAHLAEHPGVSCVQLADTIGLEDLEKAEVIKSGEALRYDHDRRLGAVLAPTLAARSPAERRTVEYAALLPPDHVPLPWLRTLVAADFPELGQPARLTDPSGDLWRHLEKLALFTRPKEEETTEPRLLRVHRLVQELVRRDQPESDRTARQQAVDALVKERDAALEKTTQWPGARWELEPFGALAALWADTGHPESAWLLNQAGQRWHDLAEWSEAEPLMRRAFTIFLASLGKDHPSSQTVAENYQVLLQQMGRSPQEVLAQLNAVGQPFGMRFGG